MALMPQNLTTLVDTLLTNLANCIEEKAVKIVDDEKLVAWGKLRRAVKTKYYPDKKLIDVFVDSKIAPYAAYIHEGREPGKMPPVSIIEEWARKKRLLSSSSRGIKLPVRLNTSAKLNSKQ